MKTNTRCIRYNGICTAQSEDKNYIVQLRCKQWDCDYCAVRNAKQWRAALLDYINNSDDKTWSFWTVTVPKVIHNHDDKDARYSMSLAVIKAGWDKLMKRAKRHLGKFQYIRVIEQHKSGAAHVHLLASVHMPDSKKVKRKKPDKDGNAVYYHHSEWLKDNAVACGFGYIHDCQNLVDKDTGENWHAGGVSGYITKYVTKDLKDNDQFRKKVRINKIQTSRGIKRKNTDSDLSWEHKAHITQVDLLQSELPYFDLSTGQYVTTAHFRGQPVYPPLEHKE